MELDKKIKEGKRPLTCFDVEEAKAFIGKECYLSNNMSCFGDLNCGIENKEIKKAELTRVSNTDPCYEIPGFYYDFCLPCEWVEEEKKEPKYRPYTLNEFINHYHLGDEVIVRRKLNKDRSIHKLFTEYGGNDNTIHLGTYWFTFQDLYDNYEIFRDGEWQPFGVIEDD